MDIKKLVKSALLIFIVVSFLVLIYKEFSAKTIESANAVAEIKSDVPYISDNKVEPEKNANQSHVRAKSEKLRVIAYYFHGTYRCITCKTIEKYSKEAIVFFFLEELKNGKLEFKSLNVEYPENRHFIRDYQLFSKSLVLSLVDKDKEIKWKILPDVWKYYRDKNKFFQYVKDEVEKFLKET